MKKIINGRVVTPYRMRNLEVAFEGDKIVEVNDTIDGDFDEIIDAKGNYVTPGFIDVHVHGGGGYTFCSDDVNVVRHAAYEHAKAGATTTCPTGGCGMSLNDKQRAEFKAMSDACEIKTGPTCVGIHLEGPASFENGQIDEGQKVIPYDLEFCADLIKSGKFAIINVAPDTVYAKEFTKMLKEAGIHASLGHCLQPNYDQFMECVEAGADQVCHIYSSMSGYYRVDGARYPGVIESAMTTDDVYTEVIADGVHLDPVLMEYIYKNKGADKMIITTDCHYRKEPFKDGEDKVQLLHLPTRITIFTMAPMDYNVNYVVNHTSIPFVDAIRMATINPAKALGIEKYKGKLAAGFDSDILIFDQNIDMKYVVARGEEIVKKI